MLSTNGLVTPSRYGKPSLSPAPRGPLGSEGGIGETKTTAEVYCSFRESAAAAEETRAGLTHAALFLCWR
jgi:hypothetical protein